MLVIILTLLFSAIIKIALREKAKNQKEEKQTRRIHPFILSLEKKKLEKHDKICDCTCLRNIQQNETTCDFYRDIFIFSNTKMYRVISAFGDTGISRHHTLLSITQIFGNDKCFKNIARLDDIRRNLGHLKILIPCRQRVRITKAN